MLPLLRMNFVVVTSIAFLVVYEWIGIKFRQYAYLSTNSVLLKTMQYITRTSWKRYFESATVQFFSPCKLHLNCWNPTDKLSRTFLKLLYCKREESTKIYCRKYSLGDNLNIICIATAIIGNAKHDLLTLKTKSQK